MADMISCCDFVRIHFIKIEISKLYIVWDQLFSLDADTRRAIFFLSERFSIIFQYAKKPNSAFELRSVLLVANWNTNITTHHELE